MSRAMEGSTRKPNPEDEVKRPEGHVRRAEARTKFSPRPARDVEPVQKAMEGKKTRINRDTEKREEIRERNAM